jgi:hypothetical protein
VKFAVSHTEASLPTMQGLLLPGLMKVMSAKWVLVIALTAQFLHLLGLAAAPVLGAWAVYAAMVVGCPSSMSVPVISALKSCNAGEEEQGKVQVCYKTLHLFTPPPLQPLYSSLPFSNILVRR